jgi:hypothetical protein
MYKSCQSRLCKADCAHLTYLMKGRKLDTAMFKSIIFSTSGFALSYAAYIFIIKILYDFLLPAQCYINAYANRGPVGTLESFQWCRGYITRTTS